mgnify:CR=1 FL=1
MPDVQPEILIKHDDLLTIRVWYDPPSTISDIVPVLFVSTMMRIFASADKIVQVDPQLPQDEEVARQQTEYLNYVFMRDNPGFMILYTWFKDALLMKNGAVQLVFNTTEGAKALALLGMELANTQGDKADIYRRINIAAGYVGPANLSETF